MKEIVKRWCETKQISIEDAIAIITEYVRLTDREITSEQINKILYAVQNGIPVDWQMMIEIICIKNNWTLTHVESEPDAFGNRRTLYSFIF